MIRLSDSTYLPDIRSIYYYNQKFYLSDYKRNQIFILNPNLYLIQEFGGTGRGPGEMTGASHIYVNNDTIYVGNDYRQSIEVFNNNGFIKTINLPPKIRLVSDIRYFQNDNSIYMSSPSSEGIIFKYNYNKNNISIFGDPVKYNSQEETRIKNKRHLLKHHNHVVSIPDCHPFVELYNLNGKFIKQVDISSITPVKKVLNYIDKRKQKRNSYLQFIQDVYVFKNRLYILLITINNNKKECNTVLELEIHNNRIKPIRLLNLGKGWYGPFCCNKNKLLVYDQTQGILKIFKL
jgi:hypothetical protein